MLSLQNKLAEEDGGVLEIIDRVTRTMLPPEYGILALVYRDVDCGVFGSKGWSLSIACPKPTPKWGLGFCFQTRPDEEEVKERVLQLVSEIEAARGSVRSRRKQ